MSGNYQRRGNEGQRGGGGRPQDRARQQDRRQAAPKFTGLDPTLPTMYDGPGNAVRFTKFLEQLRVHIRKNFFKDLDDICDPVDPHYPHVEEAVYDEQLEALHENGAAIATSVFSKDIITEKAQLRELEKDKQKVHGLIVGQLAPSSIEKLKSSAAGAVALEGKDPLELLNEIKASHLLINTRIPPEINFQRVLKIYNQFTCRPDQSLDSCKKELEVLHAQVADAAERAGPEFINQVPTQRMLGVKFIDSLHAKFGAYKLKIERREKPLLDTIQEIYNDVFTHGEEYVQGDLRNNLNVNVQQQNVLSTRAGRGGQGGRGRGRGGGRGHDYRNNAAGGGAAGTDDSPVAGTDGNVLPHIRCSYRECGKLGHMMRNCPLKEDKDRRKRLRNDPGAIQDAVTNARSQQGN